MLWGWDGALERIHQALYVAVRGKEGCEASPSAAIVDSQIASAALKGGVDRSAGRSPSSGDAGKKVRGRKRRILVDALGLLPSVVVHPADVQDRDVAFELLCRLSRMVHEGGERVLEIGRLPATSRGYGEFLRLAWRDDHGIGSPGGASLAAAPRSRGPGRDDGRARRYGFEERPAA